MGIGSIVFWQFKWFDFNRMCKNVGRNSHTNIAPVTFPVNHME